MNSKESELAGKMYSSQNRKVHNFEKQFPGCLGRVVNLFDLSAGVTSNRLLTDKPHPYGSSISRSLSDMATMLAPTFGDQTEEKGIVLNSRRISSSRNSMGTPMKMLIAEEMSKEVGSKHCPPNVIAKLMGLDALPEQQPHSVNHRSQSEGSMQHRLENLEITAEYWQRDRGFLDKQLQHEVLKYEETDYKDFYELSPQSKKNSVSGKQQQKGRYRDCTNEKKMAIVRQNFKELKRLATDENLWESKEFHNALEVLSSSSNKDLFYKCLSNHLDELQHISMPLETKRITILRPSNMIDDDKFSMPRKKNENPTKIRTLVPEQGRWDKNKSSNSSTYACQNVNDCPSQPTRIVVLKPSAVKAHDLKAVVSPTSGIRRIVSDENTIEEAEDDGVRESGEVVKELPGQTHENLAGHRRDETLLSSVLSNGYIGDDSSFHRSENEYAGGNLSDSEVMSPASRHSWDYINRVGSPYSSFSRASYSPESSVCREAKKRLSERWAMMTSNQNSQDQRHVRKGSSTLGEMLALSDTKKSVRREENGSKKEQEQVGSSSSLSSNLNKEESVVVSPKHLSRSKSVPVSSTLYGNRLSPEMLDPQVGKPSVPKQPIKKSVGSSLKGKVSSLFFSKNKKSSKGKSNVSQSKDDGQCPDAEMPGCSTYQHEQINVDSSKCVEGKIREECSSPPQHGSVSTTSLGSVNIAQEQGVYSQEGSMPMVSRNLNCIQEQPSPISVLEPSFEDDDNPTPEYFGKQPLGHSLKSNLIDKSPPIESIARTLSWDDSCFERSASYSIRSPMVCSNVEEELDWLVFVRTVLSAAGFDSEVQPETFFSRWHTPESPLDPSLREKFANTKDVKEPMPEARRRQRRSERKLVFDCVNEALIETTGYGPSLGPISWPGCKAPDGTPEQTLSISVDRVWARMTEWFPDEVRCVSRGDGGSSSLVVERVVRNEVVGKGWIEQLSLEMHSLRKDIEWTLLDELVDEAVVELTGRLS